METKNEILLPSKIWQPAFAAFIGGETLNEILYLYDKTVLPQYKVIPEIYHSIVTFGIVTHAVH